MLELLVACVIAFLFYAFATVERTAERLIRTKANVEDIKLRLMVLCEKSAIVENRAKYTDIDDTARKALRAEVSNIKRDLEALEQLIG